MEINAPHIFVQTTLSWPCMDMPVWSVKNVLGKCQPAKAGTDLKICPLTWTSQNQKSFLILLPK